MAMIEKELNDCFFHTADRLRVKVFIYFADQWREKGIGFLGVTKIENDEKSYQIYEDYYKSDEEDINSSNTDKATIMHPIYKLTVRSQQDMHERLISTYITNATDYRVQEGSIVTWKEGDTEKALSFECAEDCSKFMRIINDIRQIISNFNPSKTTTTTEEITDINETNCNLLQTPTIRTVVETDDNDKIQIDGDDWDLDILCSQIDNDANFEVNINSDDDEEYALNDKSSIWKDYRLPTLPEVSVDNLVEWIQLLSFSNPNLSNVFDGCSDSVEKSKSGVSISAIEDANQLYRYMLSNNTLNEFFDLFHHYETEEFYELDVLFKLHRIFKGFIAAESFDIYRLMFEESISTTLDVIGILEYDPTMETRVHHRDYLKNKAKFRKFFLLDDSVTNQFPTSASKTNSSAEDSAPLSKEPSLNASIDVDNPILNPNADNDTEEPETANKDNAIESNVQTNNNSSESETNEPKQSTLELICDKATLIYYIQYTIDHIMPTPSIFDDKLGPFTTYLNHHKADLCNLIYDNTMLLRNLFVFLTNSADSNHLETYVAHDDENHETHETHENQCLENESTLNLDKPTLDDYVDSVFFLHEFCLLSNSLNPSDKEFFFHWLESYNLLDVLTSLLKEPNVEIRTKVVDIIALLVDSKAFSIRAFNSAQLDKAKTTGITDLVTENVCLMDHLVCTIFEFRDDPVSLHCINIINSLLDSDVVASTDISYLEKVELFTVQFFNYSFSKFLKPFISIANNFTVSKCENITPSNNMNSSSAMLLDRLLSLLSRWINFHHDLLNPILLRENAIVHITSLLDCSHNYVVCGVVRLVRKLMDVKEHPINEALLKHGTVDKIADVLLNTCLNSNNLLNNTIVELFNFMLLEDIDTFYAPLVEKHRELFNSIDYIDTFKRIVARHDVHVNNLEGGGVSLSLDSLCTTSNSNTPNNNNNSNLSELYNSVRKRKSCEFENSEERWFNSDDTDDVINNDTRSGSSNNEDNLNVLLYEENNFVMHISKKPKRSPIEDTIEDDFVENRIPTPTESTTKTDNDAITENKSIEDGKLFDVLVGSVCKKKTNNCGATNLGNEGKTSADGDDQDDDDIFDALSRGIPIITPQLPSQRNKRPNLIKIHTNKFNSSRNLVMASNSNNSKSAIGGEISSDVDDNSPVKSSALVIDNPYKTSNSPTTTHSDGDNSVLSTNLAENTFDITNCLVETTFEDDSDKIVLNDEQTPNNGAT